MYSISIAVQGIMVMYNTQTCRLLSCLVVHLVHCSAANL